MGWKRLACGITIVLFLWAIGCDGFRADEVQCEDAVAHIANCCSPSAIANLNCVYSTHTCGGDTYPDLSAAESGCVLGATCDELKPACAKVTDSDPFNTQDLKCQ